MVRDGAKRLLTMRVKFVPRIEVLILRSGARAAPRRMGHDKNAEGQRAKAEAIHLPSFRGDAKASNYDVQLHIGESRDSGSGADAPSRNDGVYGLLRWRSQ
jgi:hypothetical protein